jgi:hypothetical protein
MKDSPDYIIPEDLLDLLRNFGPNLPELWKTKLLATSKKKALLRSLIDKVVIHRTAHDRVQVRVVWRGRAITSAAVRVTVGKFDWLSGAEEIESTIVRMSKEDFSDDAIAKHLTDAGFCSPRSDRMLESTVRIVRSRNGILRRAHQSHPCRVEGFLTIPQLARKLGISRWWISDRINNGTIKIKKDKKTKCYLFPDTPEMLAELKTLIAEYRSKSGRRKGHQHA